ncbi:MAG TPA: antitoxin Xre/MbcA/ParS toxin-binding domain-containing protein [Chitinophagaceae bacterium]|nr:antitoxin Xre/MbcA/ParS toxin-binding domain-containing protein [Chitinophagaceae bacterium]
MNKNKTGRNFKIRTKIHTFVTNGGVMNKKKKYTEAHQTTQSKFEEPAIAYIKAPFDLIKMSREGVLKKNLLQLGKLLAISLKELAHILHISERTLQRYKADAPLSEGSSERVLMLAQLYKKGVEVLDSPNNFKDWLRTPLPAFQQNPPLSYLDTSFGFQLVTDELGRIEHGIFA